MLQKVLLRCVLAGPGEPKSAPRPGQAFPRAFGSGRGALANPRFCGDCVVSLIPAG